MNTLQKAILDILGSEHNLVLRVQHVSGWAIYRLEDGRTSLSKFGLKGEQEFEELFKDPVAAVEKFLASIADG